VIDVVKVAARVLLTVDASTFFTFAGLQLPSALAELLQN